MTKHERKKSFLLEIRKIYVFCGEYFDVDNPLYECTNMKKRFNLSISKQLYYMLCTTKHAIELLVVQFVQ